MLYCPGEIIGKRILNRCGIRPSEVKEVTGYPSVNYSIGLAKEFDNWLYLGSGVGV